MIRNADGEGGANPLLLSAFFVRGADLLCSLRVCSAGCPNFAILSDYTVDGSTERMRTGCSQGKMSGG